MPSIARLSHPSRSIGPLLLVLATLPALAPPAGAQHTDFLFSTYLGGNSYDVGADIVVDVSGFAWATGTTSDAGFPGAGAPPTPEPGYEFIASNGFAAAFHSAGHVPFTTYVGGGFNESINAAAAGASGVWLGGTTEDPALSGALLVQPEGSPVALPAEAASVVDVAVDAAGDVYITGSTSASGFYVMRLTPAGGQVYLTPVAAAPKAIAVAPSGFAYLLDQGDGLTRLDPAGNPAPFAPALAAGVTDIADIAADAAGNLHLAGTAGGLYYASFTPAGAAIASRIIPGAAGTKIALGPRGAVGLLGRNVGPTFPLVRPLPVSCAHVGCPSAIVTMLGTTIVTSSVFPYRNDPTSLAFGLDGELFVTGSASDATLPVVNAFQTEQNAELDAYVFAIPPSPNLAPDCGAAVAQRATIWPLDGRLVPIGISGISDPEGEALALTVTGIRQDEPLTASGVPDAAGVGSAAAQVRASRAGKGDGRVYTVSFEAVDPQGAACVGTVRVCVPHDRGRRGGCVDGGPLFDSTL